MQLRCRVIVVCVRVLSWGSNALDKGMLTKPIFIVAPCSRSYEPQLGHGPLFSFSSCQIEFGDLGQELVTSAMDGMKVLGMGRLCFQFFAQLQNVVIDSPCTRVVLVSPHFIE